jgi:hypothetical protein
MACGVKNGNFIANLSVIGCRLLHLVKRAQMCSMTIARNEGMNDEAIYPGQNKDRHGLAANLNSNYCVPCLAMVRGQDHFFVL